MGLESTGGRAALRLLSSLAIVSVLAATACAGSAQAKLAGPDGALKGCVEEHGVLHVVAFGSRCPRGDQAIAFGAQGAAGAAGPAGAAGKEGPTGSVTAFEAEVSTLESQNATLTSKVSTLEDANSALEGKVGSLQTTLSGVYRNGSTLVFSGMNLELNSGSGSTSGAVNGLGNLFVGYDEHEGTQTGSDNVVIGEDQSFKSYGGLLAGFHNTVESPFTSVTGGEYSLATGFSSSVVGGCDNLAGAGTPPTGLCPSEGDEVVTAGLSNQADGAASTVSGGRNNVASGAESSISAGHENYTPGPEASVSGGSENESVAKRASISGGALNTATGEDAMIAGGIFNVADAHEAAVLGGCSNVAGTGTPQVRLYCEEHGSAFQAVVGGFSNLSTNMGSTILGGELNVVSGGVAEALAGGEKETLSSATNGESQIGKTLFAP
jgi:hypothetical protein